MNIRNLAIPAALAAAAFLPSAAFAGDQDFSLVNKTGYEISEVYVSQVNANDWEEDVLGQDTLDDGASVDINFTGGGACHWDLKVVYADKDTAAWRNVNLCEINSISLFYDADKDKTWATSD